MVTRKEEIEIELRQLKSKRIAILKILLIFSIVYIAVVGFIILTIYYLGVGYSWWIVKLQITLPKLALIGCIMYALFVIIVAILYATYKARKKKLEERIKPKPIYYKGKRLFIYTYPDGARGGIFSRTIIDIDGTTAINVRLQMIRPHDLWEEEITS
ncbi:MAG TPA: hypothetical protein ENG74_03800 [Thermoplasmatales archaeon]|nr:hypothetical protein [Thermoplasmatales archaeon]